MRATLGTPTVSISMPVMMTPPNVRIYLIENGWEVATSSEGEFFRHNEQPYGYFTWSEAVAYQMVKYFTLQGGK